MSVSFGIFSVQNTMLHIFESSSMKKPVFARIYSFPAFLTTSTYHGSMMMVLEYFGLIKGVGGIERDGSLKGMAY